MGTPAPLGIFRAFTAGGAPLAGGQLKTFVSGTTTPQATFTDATLSTANGTTVTLDANGQAAVWLGALAYRFDLFDSGAVRQPGYPIDGIQSDFGQSLAVLADSASTSNGDALVAMKRTFTGAVATTEHAWHEKQEINAISDAGVPNDGTTNAQSSLAAAIAAAANKTLYIPAGTYLFDQIRVTSPIRIRTDGPLTIFKRTTTSLSDKPHFEIACSNVEIEGFASIGNISNDTGEWNHALAIQNTTGSGATSIENINVGVIQASNVRGDGLYVNGLVACPVRNIRVEGVLCSNMWRSRVSVVGGENVSIGFIGSLNGNTQFGYRDLDIEPNNSSNQICDAIEVGYIKGARVQFAGYSASSNPIRNVKIGQCLLDWNRQTNTTPNSSLFDSTTYAMLGAYFDHVHLGFLKADNFTYLVGGFQTGAGSTGILQIDRFASFNSDHTETVYKTLFRAEGLAELWIGQAFVQAPAVDVYIAKGVSTTRYNWGYLGRITTNGGLVAYGTMSTFKNLNVACSGNAVFVSITNSRVANISVTASQYVVYSCTDIIFETGSTTSSTSFDSGSSKIRAEHLTINSVYYNFWSLDGSYGDAIRLRDTWMWPDASGVWRTLRGTKPTSDTAGTIIGTQS